MPKDRLKTDAEAAAAENAAAARREPSYYCSRCRTLRPESQMADDPALGFVCSGGCK